MRKFDFFGIRKKRRKENIQKAVAGTLGAMGLVLLTKKVIYDEKFKSVKPVMLDFTKKLGLKK